MSGPFAGPKPVPHSVITWPGFAVAIRELTGWSAAEMKFCAIPGPHPAEFAAKMPKLLGTMFTGAGLLLTPLYVTWTEARPVGALDGMMAFNWAWDTKTGRASTVVAP